MKAPAELGALLKAASPALKPRHAPVFVHAESREAFLRDPEAPQADNERIINESVARIRNPKTAIRAKCMQCSNGQRNEIKFCQVKVCALWPFRMGVNPFNKKVMARIAGENAERDLDEDDDEE